MNDGDDWNLWQQVINPMATDFLRLALTEREDFHNTSDPVAKRIAAREFMTLLFCAAEAMGADEIGEWAYGDDPAPDAPHAEHLLSLAGRLGLIADAYSMASPMDYKYSIPAIVREIGYLADGEAPIALRRALRDANASATRRKVEHWARALEWVQFLKQANKRISDCREEVARAYGVGVEGPRVEWRPRVEAVLGGSAIRRIDRAAIRVPHDMRFATEEEAFAALKSDGAAYQAFLREQDVAVREIGGIRDVNSHRD